MNTQPRHGLSGAGILLAVLACLFPVSAHARDPLSPLLRVRLDRLAMAEGAPAGARTALPPLAFASGTRDPDWVKVTLRLDHVPEPWELGELETSGFFVSSVGGFPARSGSVLTGEVRWDRLLEVAARLDVERIEPAIDPFLRSPLDISALEIGAELAWSFHPSGLPVSGRGIVLANLDTGVDVTHPIFWRADGDTFSWLDTNGNDWFEPGTDVIDLNRNGLADPGEDLLFVKGLVHDWSDTSNTNGFYVTDLDWLYNDANGNGVRDHGLAAGFTESDPTYGEPIFVPERGTGARTLLPGMRLVALKTCKIKAVLDAGGVVRTRGVDLILAEPDTLGHGTSMSAILVGGVRGVHKYVGIAPEAELVVANLFGNSALECAVFAESQGADVMLWEASGWIQRPLDGSDTKSFLVDAFSDSDITQVVPAGDLGHQDKHARIALGAPSTVTFDFQVPATSPSIETLELNLLWRDGPASADLSVTVERPGGAPLALPLDATWVNQGDLFVVSQVALSPRGTEYTYIKIIRWDTGLKKALPLYQGTYKLTCAFAAGPTPFDLHCYIQDDVTTWSGGAVFTTHQDPAFTITDPALADSACTVGSYSTRGLFGTPTGDLSPFSPSGPRVDGRSLADVTAPGHYDVYTARSSRGTGSEIGGYRVVSGTSASAALAAAGIGLLKQVFPASSPAELRRMVREAALQDVFTGSGYSEAWGFGKLRLFEAMVSTAAGDLPPAAGLVLHQNVPNPFNPATEIRYVVARAGRGSLRVYDLAGRTVVTLVEGDLDEGPGRVTWDGRNDGGRQVASGVYFYRLEVEGAAAVRKMILLR